MFGILPVALRIIETARTVILALYLFGVVARMPETIPLRSGAKVFGTKRVAPKLPQGLTHAVFSGEVLCGVGLLELTRSFFAAVVRMAIHVVVFAIVFLAVSVAMEATPAILSQVASPVDTIGLHVGKAVGAEANTMFRSLLDDGMRIIVAHEQGNIKAINKVFC